MCLSNKSYDLLKWIALIFLPAFAVFIKGIGEIYGLVHFDQHVTMLNVLAVFMGSLLQLSNHNYKNGGGNCVEVNSALNGRSE